jgi:hypothetical protein
MMTESAALTRLAQRQGGGRAGRRPQLTIHAAPGFFRRRALAGFASAAARNLTISGVMTESLPKSALLAALVCLLPTVIGPRLARADAGPPFLTNDPGTPGNGNWELNIAAVPTILPGSSSWQLPQLDFNYGVGERVQLTVEIPYVVQNNSGEPTASGWGNAFPGVKWRFFDQDEDGWQISTFPMYETAGSASAQRQGLAVDGPRLFLPLEVAKKVGPLSVNFEAGSYVPWHGEHEHIIGLVVGHQFSPGFDLDAELYDDHVRSTAPDATTLDVGGRYKLHRGFNLLFMAGRSIRGNSAGQVEFMGYFGVQILLSDYGRSLSNDP